jgi:tyrosine-protein phosphatase non-receptor type 5
MNFVDPKEYDIPGLVRKNRYKTILPSEYLLPRAQGGSPSPGKVLSPELGLQG